MPWYWNFNTFNPFKHSLSRYMLFMIKVAIHYIYIDINLDTKITIHHFKCFQHFFTLFIL